MSVKALLIPLWDNNSTFGIGNEDAACYNSQCSLWGDQFLFEFKTKKESLLSWNNENHITYHTAILPWLPGSSEPNTMFKLLKLF